MITQPTELRRIMRDRGPVDAAAERIRGRRILLVGTGTSWHAANIGAYFLRLAGVEAWAVQAADAALHGPQPGPDDALILLSHRGTKTWTSRVLERARAEHIPTVLISRLGSPSRADLETVANERSAAFTASHTGAMMRLAQLASALGADLGDLEAVPDAMEAELDGPAPGVDPPARLLEFTGVGPNQWTAAEGALKVAETAYVATEGLAAEQFLHGHRVALGEHDALVALDGGGPMSERLEGIAAAAEVTGPAVYRFSRPALGETLSVFPLTIVVQRIALDLATALGTNPDSFGGLSGREVWAAIEL